MKKVISFVLAAMLLVSMMPTVFAANATPGATTLTTNVPDAKYTLVIPSDHIIKYGDVKTDIETITVTDTEYFAKGKNLRVTVDYDALTSEDVNTTIPFSLCYSYTIEGSNNSKPIHSGEYFTFNGQDDNTLSTIPVVLSSGTSSTLLAKVTGLYISITSQNWGKALAGDYTGMITFTSEVVVVE